MANRASSNSPARGRSLPGRPAWLPAALVFAWIAAGAASASEPAQPLEVAPSAADAPASAIATPSAPRPAADAATPLRAPTSVDVRATSSTRIDLYWGAAPDPAAVAYRVVRDGEEIARTSRVVHTDEPVVPGASHTYAIQAVSAGGEVSPSSPAVTAKALAPGRHAAFTLAVIPDTQFYSALYPETFTAMTRWIRDNVVRRNIAYVLHVGDIVNHNRPHEWEQASASMALLDGVVPYAFVPGNHDMGPRGLALDRDTTSMNAHFPASRLRAGGSGLATTFEPDKVDNSVHLFSAGGLDWMIVALEYGPRDAAVAWANREIEKRRDRRVILLTHTYLYGDGTLHGSSEEHHWNPATGPLTRQPGGVNDGFALWEKLVRRHPNMHLVFSGHVLHEASRATPVGDAGNTVYEMLSNYQHKRWGGNGFLRLVEIDVDRSRIQVRTYSPPHDTRMIDDPNEFVFEPVDLSPETFDALRTAHERGQKPGAPTGRGTLIVPAKGRPGARTRDKGLPGLTGDDASEPGGATSDRVATTESAEGDR